MSGHVTSRRRSRGSLHPLSPVPCVFIWRHQRRPALNTHITLIINFNFVIIDVYNFTFNIHILNFFLQNRTVYNVLKSYFIFCVIKRYAVSTLVLYCVCIDLFRQLSAKQAVVTGEAVVRVKSESSNTRPKLLLTNPQLLKWESSV